MGVSSRNHGPHEDENDKRERKYLVRLSFLILVLARPVIPARSIHSPYTISGIGKPMPSTFHMVQVVGDVLQILGILKRNQLLYRNLDQISFLAEASAGLIFLSSVQTLSMTRSEPKSGISITPSSSMSTGGSAGYVKQQYGVRGTARNHQALRSKWCGCRQD